MFHSYNKNKKAHIRILVVLFIAIFFGSVFFTPISSYAVKVPSTGTGQSVTVSDPERKQEEMTKEKEQDWKEKLLASLGAAFKNALGYFLNTIAIDTATYLASGDEGQKPLFYTEGWGPYLQREADNAAGHFIEGVAGGMGWGDMCAPSFDFRMRLALGLKIGIRPPKTKPPKCSFTTMMKKWETSFQKGIDSAEFLVGMKGYFSPKENQLAVGLQTYISFYSNILGGVRAKTDDRVEGSGFKALRDPVTGEIKTPSSIIREMAGFAQDKTTKKEETYIESIWGVGLNAISAFTDTLASKFLERMMKKGLALSFGLKKEERYDWSRIEALTSPTASPQRSGIVEAREEFVSAFAPSFAIGDPSVNKIDIPTLLLDDKVINAKFKTAIDRKLTVRDAISQGLLQMDGPGSTFAYSSADREPDTNEGISYASTIILRKYRIIPVGWEIAASYIRANFQQRIYSLGDVIRGYNDPSSPFFHLIDQNWVLKSPETFCRIEGAGEKLSMDDWRTEKLYDTRRGEYDFNRHIVSREPYCADAKSCIFQDDKGNCMYYGYCTEEKSVWRFDSKACPAYYNTCQKFADSKNTAATYLASTLQSENCSASNVGCQWYCQDYNPYNNVWTCLGSGERTIKPCDKYGSCSISSSQCSTNADCPDGQTCRGDIGCDVVDEKTGETCTIEPGYVSCTVSGCAPDANIAPNPGFEKPGGGIALADSWNRVGDTFAFIKRVNGLGQKVANGTYSLSIAYYGGLINELKAKSNPIAINPTNPTSYVLSGKIYNGLTYGNAKIAILDAADNILAAPDGCVTSSDMAKSQWVDVSCTFSRQIGASNIIVGIVVENGAIPPVGTAWFDEINVHPACPERDITIFMNAEQDINESKIYFDKDVKECEANDAGCHEFIRTKQGLGTNLVINSSFEDWEDTDPIQAPRGWTTRVGVGFEYGKITEKASQGNNAIYIKNGGVVSGIIPSIDSNGIYIISIYAKRHVATVQGQLGIALEYQRIDPATGSPVAPNPTQRFNFSGANNFVVSDDWVRYVSDPLDASALAGFDYSISLIEVGGADGSDIDGVMVERVERGVNTATSYKDYSNANAVFLKKPPGYLECSGDPETDHTSCSKYSLMCGKEEVGCELYEPTNGDPPVPGIVGAYDVCPKECSGYQQYKQSQTYFEQEKIDNYFIANTGRQCSSTNVGCEEFTNLDKVLRGGEGREYFTYIRQCQKPNNSCKSFYTWIGSDVAGYQLKVYSLLDAINNTTQAAGADGEPDEIPSPRTDLGTCANAQDAIDNPNCREFYSEQGGIGTPQYAIVQNTISCTEECFPYRISNSTQSDCERSGGYWGVCGHDTDGDSVINTRLDAATCVANRGIILVGSNDCYAPQASCTAIGGDVVWNSRNQCFYQSVPSEGESCPAPEAGCREYRGTASANVRVVFTDNFETGTKEKWLRGNLSSDSLAVGGHSLITENIGGTQMIETQVLGLTVTAGGDTNCKNDPAYPACTDTKKINCFDAKTNTCVGPFTGCIARAGDSVCSPLYNSIIPDRSYIISFWAKTSDASVEDVAIVLTRNPGSEMLNIATGLRIDKEWKEYLVGPFSFDNNPYTSNLFIQFSSVAANGSHPINYDFVAIKQIQEYEYVIKNSWITPISCDTNPYVDPALSNAPQFMLGCKEYTNRDGKTLYLKSFDRLCREPAVGCEKLIDTKNTELPFKETFNEKYDISRIDVPNDSVIYMVNSKDQQCSQAARGCQAVGEPQLSMNDDMQGYSTRYFINDPKTYNIALCAEDGFGCQEFVSEQEGLVYFKDPKSRTCEYRLVPGTSSYGWFQTGSKASFPDCPVAPDVLGVNEPAKSCVGGTTSGKSCTRDDECVGGGRCQNWTGLCTDEFVSCNAYVDPTSRMDSNILPNGNLESFYTICEVTPIPCTPDGGQCPSGERCGPATRVYLWNDVNRAGVLHHASGGVGNSSSLEITASNGVISQSIDLEEGKLYTVSVHSKNTIGDARVEIQTNGLGVFTQFDNSVTINDNGNLVTLKAASEKDEYAAFAGRFFVTRRALGVTVSMKADAGWFDNIEIKKTGTYYYLSNKVDFKSCNGTVNNDLGCVLFNDLSQGVLMYNSVLTKKDEQPTRCDKFGCDSNILLKVRPDRDCGKWLECVSGREQMNYATGKRDTYCQQVALCDSLNPANGQCNNFPTVAETPQEFNIGNVDLIKNFTGYSKVGYSWGNVKTEGYYPYAAMKQKKVCVKPSGKFGVDCIEDEDCQTSALAHDGVCQPVLKIRDEKDVYESCRMYPEGGSPRWGRTGPVDTGDKPSASNIIDINNPIAALGSVTDSALATASECNYYKDENLFSGMKGFCVEKDPRSSYLCLNWLPVDEITGGWIGMTGWVENLRDNVFYCASGAALEQRKTITKTSVTIDPDEKCAEGFVCPTGYIPSRRERTVWEFWDKQKRCYFTCTPDYSDYKMTWNGFEWFDYREKFDNAGNFTKKHIMYCIHWACGYGGFVGYDPEVDDPKGYLMACDALTKTTDSDGTNKAWKRRLEVISDYKGYGYRVPDYGYTVDTKFRPFGSMTSKLSGDPASWQYIIDFIDATKVDRPYWWADTNSSNGQLYNDEFAFKDPVPLNTTFIGGQERMKRLFAQSFGNWQWNGSTYQEQKNISRCVGGRNNSTECTGNPASCTDVTSTCNASPGVCEYYSTNSSINPIMLDNVSCNEDPSTIVMAPGSPGSCLPNNIVFCATGICNNAGVGSFTPCNAANPCTVAGEICTLPPGAVNFCSAGYKVRQPCPGGDNDCRPADQRARCVGKCSLNSAVSGKDCRSTQECRIPSQCVPFSYWTPPENQCRNNVRSNYFTQDFSGTCTAGGACEVNNPADCGGNLENCVPNDLNAPGDWCGIPPQIYNIAIENATGNIFEIHNKSGNVTLKFNVKVNEDQMPMRYLMVDWGDGTPVTQTQSRFGLRDKSDIRDPFIFPHVYTYKAGSLNIYTITIKVKDNWDWCSCSLPPIQCTRNQCGLNDDPLTVGFEDDASRITVNTKIQVFDD